MSAPNSRKRAAPGATPQMPAPQQQIQQHYGNANPDPATMWDGAADFNTFFDPNGQAGNALNLPQQPQHTQGIATPSNTLARRQMNRALIPTNAHRELDPSESWQSFMGGDNALIPHHDNPEGAHQEDSIEVLEEKAQKAKREAQGKRKGIPPFVQKLSSFLEQGKNEDLIRWSQKGDSFIVMDEDEFAKTLIPELFKHNNYASFVRQLNMYGFHKRVGLSDNSMRASERKNKSPSEYSNPYFRRGHPNLLWLINKPKSGGSKGKKGSKGFDVDADSDEEVGHEDSLPSGSHTTANNQAARGLPPSADAQPLQRKEMSVIKEELSKMREQQRLILNAITRLQRNNNQLYNQAAMFQNQHDRHQHSINAILSFLANVFRKTLEDQGNTQSVSDIISSMISNQGGPQGTQPGSVVDLGDFFQNQMDASQSLGVPHKRARGLLPPIPGQAATSQPVASSTARGSSSYQPYPHTNQTPEMGHVTELFDGSPSDSQPNLRQELENNPQERMMKIINDHNATNTAGMDLPEAAELVAQAPNTLNQDQRSQLVNFMASQSKSPGTTPPATTPAGASRQRNVASASPPPNNNGNSNDSGAMPSLSPILRSPTMLPPSINEINTNQVDLEELQRLQKEQSAKISELSDMLGPLSPSGRIPGLEEGGAENYFDPNSVDLDQFLDTDAFLNDPTFDGSDFNFNLDGTAADNNDGQQQPTTSASPAVKVESRSGVNTPASTGTEEVQRDSDGFDDGGDRGKRRRVG